MQKQAPTVGRLLVMVGFALSCFGLLLFLWLAFGGAIPFAAKGYRITVPFKEAGQLALEADVRISGVSVGKVKSIEFNKDRGVTDAEIELEEQYAPLPRDAQAILRQKTLLGETYVEITPGTPTKNTKQDIPENGRMRVGNVDQSVELDEIFRAFDPKTRKDFQRWMQTQSQAVDGRGRDISDALGNLAPLAEDSTDLLEVLNAQQGAVTRLVSNTGVVFDALGERQGQLQSLINNSNRVFATTARRDAQLEQIFQILPTFEAESTLTLRALTEFGNNANPLVTQLRPAARELAPTFQALDRLAPDLRNLFEDLSPLFDAGVKGLPAISTFLDELKPLLGQLDPWLRQINPPLAGLAFYKSELNAFFSNSTAATQATNVPEGNSEQRVHYLRTSNPANPEILAVYPQRIGTNRPNPYTLPGSFSALPAGLSVFEDRQCGRLDPSILTVEQISAIVAGATTLPDLGPVSALLPPGLTPVQLATVLPDDLRALINQFVYGGFPASQVPAPPCKKQGPFPAQGSTCAGQTSDYPHVCPDAPLSARSVKPVTAAPRWDAAAAGG